MIVCTLWVSDVGIWVFVFCRMGKRKLNESDSDDSDEEVEIEKSDLLNGPNESGSNKAEGSLGSVNGGGGSSGAGSCESGLKLRYSNEW